MEKSWWESMIFGRFINSPPEDKLLTIVGCVALLVLLPTYYFYFLGLKHVVSLLEFSYPSSLIFMVFTNWLLFIIMFECFLAFQIIRFNKTAIYSDGYLKSRREFSIEATISERLFWYMCCLFGQFFLILAIVISVEYSDFYHKVKRRRYIFPTRKNRENELWETIQGETCSDDD